MPDGCDDLCSGDRNSCYITFELQYQERSLTCTLSINELPQLRDSQCSLRILFIVEPERN